MPAYKDQSHKGKTPWYVKFRYTDTEGKKQVKVKRGFPTEREALKYEEKFLQDIAVDKEYLFEKVVEFYLETSKNKVRRSTYEIKESVINKFILPEFAGKDIRDITVRDLTRWQNKYLFVKDENDKPALVLDNIEINNKEKPSKPTASTVFTEVFWQ